MTPTPLRGQFTLTERPLAIFWAGKRLPLRPMGVRLLARLAAADYVTRDELRGPITRTATLNVHLVDIRRALPEGVTIKNEFGKGYWLTVDPA